MSELYFWIILAVVPAVALLLVFVVVFQYRALQRQITALDAQLHLGLQQVLTLGTEVEELRNAVIGVGQRLIQTEQRQHQLSSNQQAISEELSSLSERQQNIQLFDPESKLYSRAVKMVQLGAGLEEVMQECELPRAEAELLFNLHQQP